MAQSNNPFEDMFKAFREMGGASLPSFDPAAFTQAGGAPMETMQEVARISSDAMQKMMARQQSMAAEAIANWQKIAQDSMGADPSSMMQRATEVSRESAETAAKNFSELSSIAGDAQAQIMAVITGGTKDGK